MTPPFSPSQLLATYADALPAYQPMLVNYTHEDKEAKGLRKLDDPAAPRPPVHFTALEMARDEPALLLTAVPGGGKTSFALDLALALAGEVLGDARHNAARLRRPVPRHADGPVLEEYWAESLDAPAYIPIYRPLRQGDDLSVIPSGSGPRLLIIDNAEEWGSLGPAALAELLRLREADKDLRFIVLGDAAVCRKWHVPADVAEHALIPLPMAQDIPAVFPAKAEAALTAWAAGQRRAQPHMSQRPRACQAAQALALREAGDVAQLYAQDPMLWHWPVYELARLGSDPAPLARALCASGPQGAILAASLAPEAGMIPALAEAIGQADLPLPDRVDAGRHLAALGDPRDLEELVAIPAGTVAIGALNHANSQPLFHLTIPAFQMARYPVTNRLYARFIQATGRLWRGTDGLKPERANAPAVDLTWHDAMAFCAWLEQEWKAQGRIAPDARLRLPTEPEWEYAARGPVGHDGPEFIYPWPGSWQADHANGLEAGCNDTTAVGLFPWGASPFGVEDMTGQVWEWTSTLWGDDPARPSLPYPWRGSTHEQAAAPAHIRRVLRGGCFSSHREKATCTYRGSLEPDGFWRGNGFRFVVTSGQMAGDHMP